jgi:streptogramin lyase
VNPKPSILVFLGFVLISIMTLSVFTSNKVYADEPGLPIAVSVDPSNGNVFTVVEVFGLASETDRVIKYTNTGSFITEWGDGRGDGEFKSARNIAADKSGNVFVTDTESIQKFTNTGKFIKKWGGTFEDPLGITVDPTGNVFIADFESGNIQEFTNNGKFIKKWDLGGPKNPLGIVADPSNGNMFVITEFDTIQKYTNDGKFIREWKKHDFVKDQHFGLSGIAVDKSGNVFVVDSGFSGFSNERIQKYSNTGKFIRQWGSEGSGNGQFKGAGDVSTDSAGNVYVTDFQNNRIQKFSNTGKFIRNWITSTEASSPLPLSPSLP